MISGRPTVYGDKLLKAARNYLTKYKDLGDVVPSVAGLACALGITRETCYAWAKDESKQEFSDILSKLMLMQERELLNGGLQNEFNSPITKMMLTKHGYSDKVEQDHTSSDNSMTPKPGLDVSKLSDAALAEIVNAAQANADE